MSTRSDDRKRRLFILRSQSDDLPARTESSADLDAAFSDWDDTARDETGPETYASEIDRESFGRAAGAGRPPRLIVRDPETGETRPYPFQKPYAVIGHSERCDVHLEHPAVSFRHAYVQIVNGRLFCVDLASRTGIQWPNGPREAGWMTAEEPILIGPYQVYWTAPQGLPGVGSSRPESISSDVAPLARLDSSAFATDNGGQLPNVYLEFLNGMDRSNGHRRLYLRRNLTLAGWGRNCRLRLEHQSVSRVHCSLVLTESGLWVVDLLGKDGTIVNGRPIQFARLEDGCELRLGKFRLTVGFVDRATPTTPRGSGFSEEFVSTLVDRFSAMQQQLMDQTQQQMAMMSQMFTQMQQSQHEMIQQEMARVNEISRELIELQRQLMAERRLPAPDSSAESASSQPNSEAEATSAPAETGPVPTPDSNVPPWAAAPPWAAGPPPWHGPNPADETAEEDEEESGPRIEAVDKHADLMQKITVLEKERRSSWQRIKQALSRAD